MRAKFLSTVVGTSALLIGFSLCLLNGQSFAQQAVVNAVGGLGGNGTGINASWENIADSEQHLNRGSARKSAKTGLWDADNREEGSKPIFTEVSGVSDAELKSYLTMTLGSTSSDQVSNAIATAKSATRAGGNVSCPCDIATYIALFKSLSPTSMVFQEETVNGNFAECSFSYAGTTPSSAFVFSQDTTGLGGELGGAIECAATRVDNGIETDLQRLSITAEQDLKCRELIKANCV